MIIGLDHISIAVKSISKSSETLRSIGYQKAFLNLDIPNPEEKNLFLNNKHKAHSIGLFTVPSVNAIELISYDLALSHDENGIQLFLNGFDYFAGSNKRLGGDLFSEPQKIISNFQVNDWKCIGRSFFSNSLFIRNNSDTIEKAFRSLFCIPVLDLESELDFWIQGLNFRKIDFSRVESKCSIISNRTLKRELECHLMFIEKKEINVKPMMDNMGINCFAFLTSDLERDTEKINKLFKSIKVYEFQMKVNQNPLRISILRTPNDVIVELIQINRGC